MNFDQAKAALEALGLLVQRLDDQFSDKWEAGLVTFISPEIGLTVERGATIKIAISKGPDLVTVPDLTGLPVDQATAKLVGGRLVLGQTAGPTTKNVVSQSPAAGQSVKAGSAVNLLLG
jgi:serine/threonine-protein kinase